MIPWGREWQPAPAFLPVEFYGWSSLVGYSPKGRKESDTTECLTRIHTCTHAQSLRCVQLCDLTGCSPPASPSVEFPRQERRSGVPFLSAGDLPNPGIEPTAPASPELAGRFFTAESLGKPCIHKHTHTHTHTHTSNLGQNRNFPSGPEAKTLHSQCRGARFDSWKLDPACCN